MRPYAIRIAGGSCLADARRLTIVRLISNDGASRDRACGCRCALRSGVALRLARARAPGRRSSGGDTARRCCCMHSSQLRLIYRRRSTALSTRAQHMMIGAYVINTRCTTGQAPIRSHAIRFRRFGLQCVAGSDESRFFFLFVTVVEE